MLAAVGECTHEFHMHCINRWLMERHEPLCPLCKRPWGMLLTPLTRSRSDDSSPHGLCLDTHHSTRRAPPVPGHEVGRGVSPRKHHVTSTRSVGVCWSLSHSQTACHRRGRDRLRRSACVHAAWETRVAALPPKHHRQLRLICAISLLSRLSACKRRVFESGRRRSSGASARVLWMSNWMRSAGLRRKIDHQVMSGVDTKTMKSSCCEHSVRSK